MSTDNIVCPACGTGMPANALLCPKCGRANISSAFAAPSTAQPAQQPAITNTTTSIFGNTGPSAPASTTTYPDMGIPKTVLPWETTPPTNSQQTATNTVNLTNQPVVAEGSEQVREELLQHTVKTLDELRQVELAEENERRQRVVQTIDELRQMKASGGQYQAPPDQPQVSNVPPTEHYVQQNRGQWAGSMVSNDPTAQPSSQREYTMRRVIYQPSAKEYLDPTHYRYGLPQDTRSNTNTAVNLEYLGYLGLLGLGHIYAGFYRRGAVLFLGWLIFVGFLVQSIARGGGGACFVIPALAVPVLSSRWLASSLHDYTQPPRQQ